MILFEEKKVDSAFKSATKEMEEKSSTTELQKSKEEKNEQTVSCWLLVTALLLNAFKYKVSWRAITRDFLSFAFP